MSSCHVCGSDRLDVVADFGSTPRVTSDCRPWVAGGAVAVCGRCAVVQKVIDAAWRADADAIYAGYALYSQSMTRTEQHSFDASSGFGQPRSSWILGQLKHHLDRAGSRRMLDLGCGIGVTLRAFHDLAPGWLLEGFDPNLKDKASILALPGVAAVHGGVLKALDPGYGCITCFHVLEHIVDPLPTLREARSLLADDGFLIIQVPYYRDNAFDLVIADHCSHFTPATLTPLLAQAGLSIVLCSTETVAREMTLVARPASALVIAPPSADDEAAAVRRAFDWLQETLAVAERATGRRPFGIFGTSIAGTLVGNALGDAIDFFVDEDATRIGGSHLGRTILGPADIPEDATLMIALMPRIAELVATRVAEPGRILHMPPAYPY